MNKNTIRTVFSLLPGSKYLHIAYEYFSKEKNAFVAREASFVEVDPNTSNVVGAKLKEVINEDEIKKLNEQE